MLSLERQGKFTKIVAIHEFGEFCGFSLFSKDLANNETSLNLLLVADVPCNLAWDKKITSDCGCNAVVNS